MNVWQSVARITGVAFQVFAAVGLGILAGLGVKRLVPAVHAARAQLVAGIGRDFSSLQLAGVNSS